MSERSRDLPRRSCLSIPGSSEKMLGKGPGIPADMVFLDLEDAVAPKEKEAARAKVVDAIRDQDWGDKVLCVRVNDWSTEVDGVRRHRGRRQRRRAARRDHAAEGARRRPRSSPSTCCSRQVEQQAGLPVGHIGIEAQIETARGLINVEEICAASPRLETIIFGPADFAASMEMPVLTGGRADPRVPRRPLPLRVQQDPDGRPGQRPAGDRRAVPLDPRPRRLPRLLQAHPHPRLRRQVGAAPRPGHDPQRGVLARPRSSSTRPGTSSTPTSRPPRARARARSCSATR